MVKKKSTPKKKAKPRAKGRKMAMEALSAFAKEQEAKGEGEKEDLVTVVLSIQLVRNKEEQIDQIAEWLQTHIYDLQDVRDVQVRRVFDPYQPTYVCSKCGGHEIQSASWVYLNTDEVADEFGTFNYHGTTFCGHCDNECGEGHQRILINLPGGAVTT